MRPRNVRKWLASLGACGLLLGSLWAIRPRDSALADTPDPSSLEAAAAEPPALEIETLKPLAGGLQRSTALPGTIIAFESASLFAKVSGYLKSQGVDIGDTVHQGDELAQIESPETVKAVQQAKATVDQATAQVAQADARVQTAEADKEAASAAIKKARAGIMQYTGARELRQKQLARMRDLHRSDSVEKRLVDEQESDLLSARSAEDGAIAEVANTEALAHAADARVTQAKADAMAARANLEVAEAALDRAKVFVEYLRIVSPYDGVVTRRNFFRGDFIRSADQQTTIPLLVVERTDRMRVIVQVPDRDVPCTRPGAVASVKIDALPGMRFEGKVSRVAASEDSDTRTMRAEIDVANDNGLLCQGMYGYVTIELPGSVGAMHIPSSALAGPVNDGAATVYLVKAGQAHLTNVRVGRDSGEGIEVLAGISPEDDVAVTHVRELTEGRTVIVVPAKEKPTSKS